MSPRNFVKGMGIGMVVGSAIGMTVATANKKGSRQNQRKVSKVIKTVGDIVENIGNTFSM